MEQPLKDWKIRMDTDDWWWLMGKVGGGDARKLKVRDVSAIFNGRRSCKVLF